MSSEEHKEMMAVSNKITKAMHDKDIVTIPMPVLNGENPQTLMDESLRRLAIITNHPNLRRLNT